MVGEFGYKMKAVVVEDGGREVKLLFFHSRFSTIHKYPV